MTAPFRTGDTVRLKNGKSPIKVLEVDFIRDVGSTSFYKSLKFHRSERGVPPPLFQPGWFIRFAYLSSLDYEHEGRCWRRAEDFTHYKEEEAMNVLYQTKEEKPRFGTFLTKSKGGKIVLEMKGSNGDVESFDADQIEEVLPFTVKIRHLENGGSKNIRHYEMKEGEVEEGEILVHISTGNLYIVDALDTKNRQPMKSTNGFISLGKKRLAVAGEDN